MEKTIVEIKRDNDDSQTSCRLLPSSEAAQLIQWQVCWRKISSGRPGGEKYPGAGVVVEKAPMSDLQVEASMTQPGPGNSCSI